MFSGAYKRYVLGALTLVYTLNFLDRGLMLLLLQPIKEDLRLSDTQLGFLTGIAFGLFYATLGLPIARWADRGNRVTITAAAIALWGVTVMSCHFVVNFAQLVAARIAAAIGEAGCMPPTYSLVGDYFPKAAERARAMAIYMLANPLSALIGIAAGGWLYELYGWRVTFFVMGAPALLVAVLVKMTVTEPRTQAPPTVDSQRSWPSLRQVLTALWRQPSSRHLGIAITLLWTLSLGLGPWYAAFMMRSHAMGTAELGVWLALTFGPGGIGGLLLGGYVSGRWFAHNDRGQMVLSAAAIAALFPCLLLFLLVPQRHYALAALMLFAAVFSFVLGPSFALMQRLVSDDMRATTIAAVMLLANLIGMGVGPQVVGVVSDLLMARLGNESLRYAMLSTTFLTLWAAYHLYRAGRTVRSDLLKLTQSTRSNVSAVPELSANPAA